jgi:hypothetical protein
MACARTVKEPCFALPMRPSPDAASLVALEVRNIDFHPDGTGQALIRRSKTDKEGQGRMAYLRGWRGGSACRQDLLSR